MTAISQEKIKSTYKVGVIIEKATPEVLQDFLNRNHIDCPENMTELSKGKDYKQALLSILQKADIGVLERLHNVAMIAQNSPALPLASLWAYRDRYDIPLPDTMGYYRPMDAVLWMASHHPQRFKTFVATQRYHFQGKRTRTPIGWTLPQKVPLPPMFCMTMPENTFWRSSKIAPRGM